MTDFGRRPGDMLKSVYDQNYDNVVDNAQKLNAFTLAQVRDHTPKTHTHIEAQIIDLAHNALAILGVPVDDTDKGDGKGLYYNLSTQKLEYETPPTGGVNYVDRGDPNQFDYTLTNLTLDGNWHELDLSTRVPAGANPVHLAGYILDNVINQTVIIKKNGNQHEINAIYAKTIVSNVSTFFNAIIEMDANRKLEYNYSNIAWNSVGIVVAGWFI